MTKHIYVEPAWKMHSYYNRMVNNPPEGYTFIAQKTNLDQAIKKSSRFNISYQLFSIADSLLPLNLIKSRVGSLSSIPDNIDLIYAFDHLVYRKIPWVVDIEFVTMFTGYHYKNLKRYRRFVEQALRSDYCRKILCCNNASKRSIQKNLNCEGFEDKFASIPLSGIKKDFTKTFDDTRVKILFVGSSNITGQFEMKGGLETLEVFTNLQKTYDNVEMVVRSDLPQYVKQKYQETRNLTIIDEEISWEELENHFKTADIFILPEHNTPYSAFIDAMSYELPVVGIDSWANPEIIDDGKTGLLARHSKNIQYYAENFIPVFETRQFKKAIAIPDPAVVDDLVKKVSILIEDKDLRRKMGQAARHEVEQGKFSQENKNRVLKEIFDEALG